MAVKNIEMQKKNADGTFDIYHPKTKASMVIANNGSNLESHLADKVQHVSQTEKNTWSGKQNSLVISSSVTSTSTTQVANSAAVRTAMNRADAAFQSASDGKTLVTNAIAGIDNSVVVPSNPSFGDLAGAIDRISTGKKWGSGEVEIKSIPGSSVSEQFYLDFIPRYVLHDKPGGVIYFNGEIRSVAAANSVHISNISVYGKRVTFTIKPGSYPSFPFVLKWEAFE